MRVEEWLGADNQIGIDIWHKKYQNGNESFDEWLDRVSGGDESVKTLIKEKKFLFQHKLYRSPTFTTLLLTNESTKVPFQKEKHFR